jgi:hypothetical protein
VPSGHLLRPAPLFDGVTLGSLAVLPDLADRSPRPFQRIG